MIRMLISRTTFSRAIGLAVCLLGAAAGEARGGETQTVLDPVPGLTQNTGEKPQSKTWHHAGTWWACLASDDPSPAGTWIWRLENNGSWTAVFRVSTATNSRVDVKPMGDVVHILLHDSSPELASAEYVAGGNTWQAWSQRPANTAVSLSGSETANIDIDSTGRLWLASDSSSAAQVRWSDPPYTSFSGPHNVGTGITADDICAVIAMPDDTVGLFWSNQNTELFGFSVHQDGASPTSWGADEEPGAEDAQNAGAGMADDHINLAVSSGGTVYSCVKTSYDDPGLPTVGLLVRRPNGNWDPVLYDVDSGEGTRGIVMINEDSNTARVVYKTDQGNDTVIAFRDSSASSINFGGETTVITGGVNNPTSTKQTWTNSLVMLASGDRSPDEGPGILWESGVVVPEGACCLAGGSCTFVTETICDGQGGVYQGDGVGCGAVICPGGDPDGACCMTDGSCEFITEFACDADGGTWQGEDVTCGQADCPQPGPGAIIVGHWKMNEGGGNQIIDDSGQGNDGDLNGNPQWVPGQQRLALDLDGNGDFAVVPDHATLDLVEAATMALWVRPRSISTHRLLHKVGAGSGYELRLSSAGNATAVFNNSGALRVDSTTLYSDDIDEWMHVAVTYDGAVIRLYVNGVQEDTVNAAFTIQTNTADLGIGATPAGSNDLDGLLDEVRLYGFALDASEIAVLAANGLVAHWKMDENGGSTLVDDSGQGTHGELMGNPAWVPGIDGLAIQFDGQDDFAVVPDGASFDFPDEVTFAFWIRPEIAATQRIMRKTDRGDGYDFFLSANGFFSLRFNADNDLRLDSDFLYSSVFGEWVHVAGVYDGTAIRIYINGEEDASLPASFSMVPSPSDLGVCARPTGSQFFEGALDDLRIYHRALNPEEIAAMACSLDVSFPADVFVECGEDTDPGATGEPAVNLSCGAATVNSSDAVAGGCGGTATITRTWTVEDVVGNTAEHDQIITVVDTTDPFFTSFPGDLELECPADTDPAFTGTPTGADDCGSVSVSFDDSFSPGCSSTGTLTRTWTVEDDCGNGFSANQAITIVDTTGPVISQFPADQSLSCADDLPGPETGLVAASDACGGAVVSHEGDSDNGGSACGGDALVVQRTYRVTDDCGNFVEQVQTFTIADDTPPQLTGFPADVTRECVADVPAVNTGQVSASDDCTAVVAITHEGDADNGGSGCPGDPLIITRTYRATDGCGNFTDGEQTITIVDSTDPVIDQFPADGGGACPGDVPPPDPGLVTATDNCAGPVTITHQGDSDNGGAGCQADPLVITRTYRATDACGNFTEGQQVFTVMDAAAPTVDSFPADESLSCPADLPAADTGLVMASDNCPGEVTVTHVGDADNGGLGCPGDPLVVIRTYRITDACGNFLDQDQTFTIADDSPPVFDLFPADASFECLPDPDTGLAQATDSCGAAATITHEGDADDGGSGCAGDPRVVMRTYRATSPCGTFVDQVQTITVEDLSPPVIDTFPADAALSCLGEVPAADTGLVTATDNCGGPVTVTHEGDSDNGGAGCPGEPLVVSRTYRAADGCGNVTDQVQTFTIVDATDPVIDVFPADESVSCSADVPPADPGSVSASDNCGGVVTVTLESEASDGGSGSAGDPEIITRTYRATDPCGNFVEQSQTITVADGEAPSFDAFPADAGFACPADVPAADVGLVTASDNCGGDVTITHEGDADNGGSGCPGDPFVVTRTYRATDGQGNFAEQDQTFTVLDDVDPVIDSFPADSAGECPGDVPPPATGLVGGSDNCGEPVTVTHEGDVPGGGAGCAGDPLVITRTYRVTDACGNFTEQSQTFTLIDVTDPVIDVFPSDGTVDCLPPADPALVQGSDNCGAPVAVTHEGDSDDGGAGCPGDPRVVSRAYRVADACGNFVEQVQTLTVIDDVDPVIDVFPADAQVSCPDDVLPADTGLVEASDNCGGVTVAHEGDVDNGGAGCPGDPLLITRTYSATDGCGNATTQDQIITALDETAPAFDVFPADAQVACFDGVPAADTGLVAATDDCSGTNPPVTITFEGDTDDGGAGCAGDPRIITRTYRATDDCGNFAEQDQVFTIVDDVDPAIDTFPADGAGQCASDVPPADIGLVSGSDNCGGPVTVTHEGDGADGGAGCAGDALVISRTYRVTDACGNFTEQTQTFTLIDTTAPVIDTFPADETLECLPDPDPGLVQASDNCGGLVTVTHEGDADDGGSGCAGDPRTVTRTYRASDGCGNFVEQQQTIVVADATAPVIDEFPADETVACPPDPDPDLVIASDNCGEVTVTHAGDVDGGGSGCAGDPRMIMRTYRAEDPCGLFVEQVQEITVVDDVPPTFDAFPEDANFQCADDVPPPDPGQASASDNCGGPVSVTFEGEADNGGAGCVDDRLVIIRTYRATDACGNFTEEIQFIVVLDTTPPAIDSAPPDAGLSCSDQVPAADPGLVSASDGCGGPVTVTHAGDSENGGLGCAGSPLVVSRTYRAVDQCGNVAEVEQLFTIVDETPPAFDVFPADDAVVCPADVPAPDPGSLSGDDDCGGPVTISHVGDADNGGLGCAGDPLIIVRTWRAEDGCGNFTDQDQTFTVIDETAPAIDVFPADEAVVCLPDPDPGLVEASDACGGEVTVTHEGDSDDGGAGCPGDPRVVTRTYRATDPCGNFVEQAQTITVADDAGPQITACPPTLTVPADAGGCTATLLLSGPEFDDNCGDATVEGTRSDGEPLEAPFPTGTTTVIWTVTDPCGNSTDCDQDVEVEPVNEVVIDVQLSPTVSGGLLTRCISFELYEPDCGFPQTFDRNVTFAGGTAVGVVLEVPCGEYTCITARDKLHTLRRTDEGFTIAGSQYVADFTGNVAGGGDWLVGGDANLDGAIDMIDFGSFSSQYGTGFGGGDTLCGVSPVPHTDFSGDGLVAIEDFSFIQINFGQTSDAACCAGQQAPPEPVLAISVSELIRRGLGELAAGDLNHDGMLDALDIVAFMNGARPVPVVLGLDGAADGGWFDGSSWSSASVPDETSDVAIFGRVLVDRDGAEAASVLVETGGVLRLDPGSLSAGEITVRGGGGLELAAGWLFADVLVVERGGVLSLLDAGSVLDVGALIMEPGAVLEWIGGTLEVRGGPLVLAGPDLLVGGGLGAVLRLSAGAGALVRGDVLVAPLAGDAGVIEVDGPGSRLDAGGLLWVGAAGAGVLALSDGGVATAGDLFVGAAGRVELEASAWPAVPIDVAGLASLGGTLEVRVAEGEMLAPGDRIELIRAAAVVGAFDAVELPDVGPGVVLEIRYERDAVVVVGLES